MVTAEQNAYNLRTVSKTVAERLRVNKATMTYDQAIAYNRELAREILKYPQSFTEQTLGTAALVLNRNYTAEEDPLSAWETFAPAVADGALAAGAAVGGIGDGVLGVASAAKWLIPAAVVVLLGITLYRFSQNQKSA